MDMHEMQQSNNYVLLLLLGVIILAPKTTSQSNITKPGCPDSCGSVKIPYPFGTSPGCYYNHSFLITCNQSSSTTTTTTINSSSPISVAPFFPRSNVSILNISLDDGELRVETSISRDCYDKLGNLTINQSSPIIYMPTNSDFPLSTRNKFTAVGCDTVAVVAGSRGRNYATGCVAMCNKTGDVINGSCSGIGCCEISVPQGVYDYASYVLSLFDNHTTVHSFNPCGYAFVVEDGVYNFSSLDLMSLQNRETFPVVLDWAIGNLTCEEAKKNINTNKSYNPYPYACQATYSECLDSTNGPGYRCKCSQGFQGNPYLVDGCQDIDECETSKPCNSTCHNLLGSFSCSCPKGYDNGDGFRNGTGCSPGDNGDHSAARLAIALSICIGLLALLVGGSWIYWGLKKRKLIKLREKFFQQNGGLLLKQQQLPHLGGSTETAKIFRAEELKKATNNYDKSRVIGQGGYGTVYKGYLLTDNKVVAIKKSKVGDQSQIEQFINEVIVLSQINHRNIVKLLGCCLETEVPLLVYEFVTNRTLSEHIHDKGRYHSLSWEMRLKIAIETAGAVAYLHSSTSMPIIHRDIKTANILLDDNYTAKVSDFGASRLVPLDQTRLTTLVQGTLGYLDPEYFQSSQLTEKSDVYSFGVVLAELLTAQKALSLHRPECHRNLAMYFVSSMKEDRLLEVVDRDMLNDANVEQLKLVANLAKSCLRVKGEERPTMKEVANELEGILNQNVTHPWQRHDDDDDLILEETEYFVKTSDPYLDKENHDGSCSNTTTFGFGSMDIEVSKR